MLPFAKRKKPEEIELDDADIVVVEDEPIEIDVAELEVRPELPRVSAPAPKASLRRLITPHNARDSFEDDVADECLKSIAAATNQVRRACLSDSFPASIVPAAPHAPRFETPLATSVDALLAEAPLPQFELSDADETTRRPAISSSAMPIARDSVPGVLAVPPSPPSASSIPTPVFSRTSSPALPALPPVSSIAPVSLNSTPGPVEPTVILVRQPPKTAWIVAAALLGAACALLAMHVLVRPTDAPPTVVVTPPPPPATEQATPAAAPAATVRFNEGEGVVIAAPPAHAAAPPPAKPAVTTASVKPAPAAPAAAPVPAKPASKPAASLGPKLPDGSTALTSKAPPAPPPAAAPHPAPQPEPAPATKRKLTPEQELAEAQLKASMK